MDCSKMTEAERAKQDRELYELFSQDSKQLHTGKRLRQNYGKTGKRHRSAARAKVKR